MYQRHIELFDLLQKNLQRLYKNYIKKLTKYDSMVPRINQN